MNNIDGFSEREFARIFNEYENITTQNIIQEISEEHDIDLTTLQSARNLLQIAVSKGITEGMKIGLNRYRVYDVVDRYPQYQSPDTQFIEGIGVCGILTPEGTFLKCNNAEHHKLVKDISLENQHRCIYFTSFCDGIRKEGNISASPSFQQATREQLGWINKHQFFFDEGQNHCSSRFLD